MRPQMMAHEGDREDEADKLLVAMYDLSERSLSISITEVLVQGEGDG